MKVTGYVHDPFIVELYTKEQEEEWRGIDYFDEYAVEIPDKLFRQYEEIKEKFWDAQKKINKLLDVLPR